MSFSNNVKEELFKTLPQARHCRIAELAALIGMSGTELRADALCFENRVAGMKAQAIIKKLFGFELKEESEQPKGNRRGLFVLRCKKEEIAEIFETVKIKRPGFVSEEETLGSEGETLEPEGETLGPEGETLGSEGKNPGSEEETFGSEKQRFDSEKLGLGSGKNGIVSKKQGFGSREQDFGSKEQEDGTKNKGSGLFSVDKPGQNIHNTLQNDIVPGMLVCTQTCCKRAFLRGAFLTCGSLSDPEKDYHLEFVLKNEAQADMLRSVLASLSVEAGSVMRKKAYVLYIKDSEMIATVLTLADATVALMELENIRILKEVRNDVNRRVNCETANIEKTVRAASKQVEDIRFLAGAPGFDDLPEELKLTAALRLEHPEVSLSELAMLHPTSVSRSGINHRLKKLCILAEKLRDDSRK